MTVALSPETQKLLEIHLQSGQYGSADELWHAALEVLDLQSAATMDHETLDAIDQAEDEIERGEVHDWKDVRERVRARFQGK